MHRYTTPELLAILRSLAEDIERIKAQRPQAAPNDTPGGPPAA